MSEVYLDGAFVPADQAKISPMDRGFLFADGVYEVIPVFNGTLFRLEEHLRRLERSLSALYLLNPYDRTGWHRRCEELVQRNGGGNLSVYMQITRGVAARRDHAFPDPAVPPTVFMSTAPLALPASDSPDSAQGASAITLDDIRWSRCDIKSISLLPNILLRQQAVAAGALEAILVRDGFITEGAASNVFLVKEGEIATPPCSHAILGGITRDLIIELCRDRDLPIREREISETELSDADEVWISSSTRDVVPIVTLDNRPVGNGRPGETWKILARHYIALKRRLCGL